MVRDGYFGFQDYFESLCDKVEGGNDFYLLGYDFQSYLEAQVDLLFNWNSQKSSILVLYNLKRFQESSAYTIQLQAAADKAFVDQEKWTRMSILSTSGSGRFSSDRTIEEYAEKTWGIEPCKCPF